MRYGNVVLAILAVGALAIGVGAQKPKDEPPISTRLFAKATAEDFIGEESCGGCHTEITENFAHSGHASFAHKPGLPIDKQGCEGCHGPGKFHLDEENPEIISFKKISPRDVDEACLRCHKDVMDKAGWGHTPHAGSEVSCVSCHKIHTDTLDDPETVKNLSASAVRKEKLFPAAKPVKNLLKADEPTLCGSCHQAATNEFRRNSRHPVPEGRLDCSDCHDVHNSKAAKKRTPILKEKCVVCHAETVGPFVFEHDPVAGWTGDGCQECHKAHGSHNPDLLKSFSSGMCASCHTDKTKNHYTGRSCWSAGCHQYIHGSNSDPTFRRP